MKKIAKIIVILAIVAVSVVLATVLALNLIANQAVPEGGEEESKGLILFSPTEWKSDQPSLVSGSTNTLSMSFLTRASDATAYSTSPNDVEVMNGDVVKIRIDIRNIIRVKVRLMNDIEKWSREVEYSALSNGIYYYEYEIEGRFEFTKLELQFFGTNVRNNSYVLASALVTRNNDAEPELTLNPPPLVQLPPVVISYSISERSFYASPYGLPYGFIDYSLNGVKINILALQPGDVVTFEYSTNIPTTLYVDVSYYSQTRYGQEVSTITATSGSGSFRYVIKSTISDSTGIYINAKFPYGTSGAINFKTWNVKVERNV